MRSWAVLALCLLASGPSATLGRSCSPNGASGSSNITITVNGVDRVFDLYIPFTYEGGTVGPPSSDKPLVINWHGCNADLPELDYHLEISKVKEAAMDYGYYSITPVGTQSIFGSVGWNTDGILCGSVGVNDFTFFEAILNYSAANLCVNTSRIYTIGFSTGGFMSNGIGCRYPESIAGVGTDAGSLDWTYMKKCKSMEGAIPFQSFHSLTDPTVPYNGTDIWAGQLDIDEMWREKNGCDGTEEPYETYSSETSSCMRWNCSKAPVEACTINDMDHCWYGGRSGGYPSCQPQKGDVDVTARMFAFWDELA